MGGSITIAARFNDGQAICIDGWTNFIPNMIMNETTLSGNDGVVRKTLMEAAVHSAYTGPGPFRAEGYGMVVIDFVARELHSMQGYTGFTSKMIEQLFDLQKSGWRDGKYSNVLSDAGAGLLEKGRISIVRIDGEECEPVRLTATEAVEIADANASAFLMGKRRRFHELSVDTAPMVVRDYPESGSLTKMKAALRAAGFPLTRKQGLNDMLIAQGITPRTR